MDINTDLFKKPFVWAIIVPTVLGIWALGTTVQMAYARKDASGRREVAQKVLKDTDAIAAILKDIGQGANADLDIGTFDGLSSALACAETARIPHGKLTRGSGFSPVMQKDGRLLERENYIISGVRLLQVARFVDHAERNFLSVNCTKLILQPAGTPGKDAWNATVHLEYRREPESES